MKSLPVILWLLALPCLSLAQTTGDTSATEDEDLPEETQNATDEEDLRRFWQLALPEGNFLVSLDRIASISKHSYLLDGGLVVTEVTIDTIGNALCRIYQITPAGEDSQLNIAQQATQRARELTSRGESLTGADINTMVQKTYPHTTHAKTIEYRVKEKATLNALYSSLTTALVQGKGRTFTIAQ
ncbi:MAG: hypothetical protein Q7Q71_05435 [Verrucomicrobiota bacterium JB023]|nr:hypothetical protein [Verrucomicrobiota bacterium JB023]